MRGRLLGPAQTRRSPSCRGAGRRTQQLKCGAADRRPTKAEGAGLTAGLQPLHHRLAEGLMMPPLWLRPPVSESSQRSLRSSPPKKARPQQGARRRTGPGSSSRRRAKDRREVDPGQASCSGLWKRAERPRPGRPLPTPQQASGPGPSPRQAPPAIAGGQKPERRRPRPQRQRRPPEPE
jgi:hypothetical protein